MADHAFALEDSLAKIFPHSSEKEEKEMSQKMAAVDLESGYRLLIFPQGVIYPYSIADPHRVGFGIQRIRVLETGTAETGDRRYNLKAGGRLGLVGLHVPGQSDRSLQLSVEVGYDAQFDLAHGYDNIGWDGNYGMLLTGVPGRGLALKLGVLHQSSHVGDEYAERTGRRRIGYTREEIVAGVSLAFAERWRSYVEAGWGYDLRNDELQEPGRMQIGLESKGPESLWKGCLGWYAAMDISATQERDWRIDTSLQVGFMVDSGVHIWRLGVEYYEGRSTIGEFFQDDESYISIGLWFDI